MKKLLFLCTALFALVQLAGCDKQSQPVAPSTDTGNTLTVLAGSELKDIEPLLPQVARATGVNLQMRYAGTLEAVERLQAGSDADIAWLSSNRYAMLVPQARARILASERTMLTPVVLGLKESKAVELGWKDNPKVTWKDIAAAAEKGRFTFGMTSPSSSNTGFSGLLGLAAALSGKGDALEEKDIDAQRLSAFFKAQRLTAGSSGWLADAYLREQDKVDGMINYASTLLAMNRGSALKEKLVLIYPQDGILTADYPIMLLNPAKRDAYNKVVAYLRGTAFQQAMTDSTLRMPVNPEVKAASAPAQSLVELEFPAKLAVVDAILTAFDDNLRLPTDSSFVLDKSGSMASGGRIQSLNAAMTALAGGDSSISGRFARFRNRERITLLTFSDHVESVDHFDMGDTPAKNRAALDAIAAKTNQIVPGGETAIFSSVQQAYQEAAQRRRNDPARFYSVVLMTDGENNHGIDVESFSRWYAKLPETDKGIKVFAVLFGEAKPVELQQLVNLTGGRLFDGRKNDLKSVFKDIRGYQ